MLRCAISFIHVCKLNKKLRIKDIESYNTIYYVNYPYHPVFS